MKTLRRFDRVTLDKGEMTSQGFLRVPAFLTRTGVFKYRRKDGSVVRELRHPDDVFAQASLDTLRMAPLTNDHPEEFVTPDNVKELGVGWISDAIEIVDGKKLGTHALIADKIALAQVEAGKVELSCGYTADLVQGTGTYDGEPYDCRQTNIRYNHVAIVERGRAGPGIRLRLDSDDAVGVDSTDPEETSMKMKIGDKEFELPQEACDAINSEFKSRDDAFEAFKKKSGAKGDSAAEIATAVESATKSLKAENDKLQAKFDTLEEKLAAKKDGIQPGEVSKLVKERARIEKVAVSVLGAEAKLDDKSDLDIIKEVLVKHDSKIDVKVKSEDYLRARFDSLADENEGREDRRTQLRGKIEDARKDEEFDSGAARKRNLDTDKDLWKTPLASQKK